MCDNYVQRNEYFVGGSTRNQPNLSLSGPCSVPIGLEDVSKYPNLFAELIRRGFSDDDVKKISRLNLIRVLQAVEKTSRDMADQFPDNTLISPQPNGTCRPDF